MPISVCGAVSAHVPMPVHPTTFEMGLSRASDHRKRLTVSTQEACNFAVVGACQNKIWYDALSPRHLRRRDHDPAGRAQHVARDGRADHVIVLDAGHVIAADHPARSKTILKLSKPISAGQG